ncbi:MAG: hypothetical protein VYE64_00590 [Planctomycetota bacterium]|nr:hypothetical protein [Planctomycetota bacterium]
MLGPPQVMDPHGAGDDLVQHAVDLLSQQVWCWGQDILRPEGNWLLEIGFDRAEPPVEREECSSVYSLDLPSGAAVVLRGFGVFLADRRRGGVFLPRYEFRPRYFPQAVMDPPPWAVADLPEFDPPGQAERGKCVSLCLELVDWIRTYEVNILETLGLAYRESTLERWESDQHPLLPAEEMAGAWRRLGVAMADHFAPFLAPRDPGSGAEV